MAPPALVCSCMTREFKSEMWENGIRELPLAISPARALAPQYLSSQSEWTCSEPPGFGPVAIAIRAMAKDLHGRLAPVISLAGSEHSIGVRHADEGG